LIVKVAGPIAPACRTVHQSKNT